MQTKNRNEKIRKRQSRRARVRTSIDRSERVWLTVYRSARHIYAQLDDPESGKTLATVSTRQKGVAGELSDAGTGNVAAAKAVGTAIAKVAKEKDITKVVFNRNGFLYHGRVKALADAAREAGLEF
ncbi:MAG: 50S ribosomal protein L18 [Deltaproteobacteria bacterium]|nr:50S ribosomal protein L18 [Deltaproteobacteria bacterium]MBW2421519.1 50S ribosomal protein L18 [Deltaproteobacteria bacterium]